MRRTLIALLACVSAVAGLTDTASSVAPTAATLTISPDVGPPHIPITAHGAGFLAGETVDLSFEGTPIGKAHTEPEGTFVTKVRVPSSAAPGEHEVLAVGETSGRSASATYLVRTDWARFTFDGANRWNRFENVLNPDNVGQLTKLWSVPDCCGDPVLASGVLYATSGNTEVSAFDAATGTVLWATPLGSSVRLDPIEVDGKVLVGLLDGTILSLDAVTGDVAWSVLLAPSNVHARLGADGERLYVPMDDKTLTALDLLDGTTEWVAKLSPFPSGVAVSKGVVYVAALDGTYALEAATGNTIWASLEGCYLCEAITYSGGRVFTGANGADVAALDASTGTTLWSATLEHSSGFLTAPAAANGVLFVPMADLGWFYALDARTGGVVWSRAYESDFWASSPAVARGVVYIGNDNGSLVAVDAASGATLWEEDFDYAGFGPPIVADGRVYVSAGGTMFAFGLPGAP